MAASRTSSPTLPNWKEPWRPKWKLTGKWLSSPSFWQLSRLMSPSLWTWTNWKEKNRMKRNYGRFLKRWSSVPSSTAFSTETRNPPSPEHTPMQPETTRKDETVHWEEAPGREIRRTVRDNSPFSANQLRTVNHPLPRLLLKAISLQNLPTEGRKVRYIRI